MDMLPLIIIGIGVISVIVVIAYLAARAENERRLAMARFAETSGLAFRPILPNAAWEHLNLFDLGQKTKSAEIKNYLKGETAEVRIEIGDWVYVTGAGKSRQTHRQSFICLFSPHLQATPFELRAESFLDRIGGWLGMQDIDFDEDPVFSKAFVLKSPDVPGTRGLFGPPLRTWFVKPERKNLRVQLKNNYLCLYRHHFLFPPTDIKIYLEEAISLLNLLLEEQNNAPADNVPDPGAMPADPKGEEGLQLE